MKEAHREAKQNADDIVELQGERDHGQGGSEEGTLRPTFTPKSTKLPKGAKLSDGINPTFKS
ncbi:hypothetical protein TSTA_103900 [Talaromyces stipitatus ATCC 10500]|uniref:Uncharacterized protein n=1 Tax=Talaromyces stipitatus (strain ATCC 10500 / CBS 375.48 / QM 6759 / NRRL 1006) TaxID=441959 RepID=B8MNT2_TALSN|nr:uncharacterized protein TSTA_103900 [Talaromyces stipitatus ATCC 10500]EED14171.1 hypothetical protein TSTA_103900 [Talaromyces stipitatus ATCC 10500]